MAGRISVAGAGGNPVDSVFLLGFSCRPEAPPGPHLLLNSHLYTYTLSILGPFRLESWWEHKLSPILATIYATAALSRILFPYR
jgi:hypothetical protein